MPEIIVYIGPGGSGKTHKIRQDFPSSTTHYIRYNGNWKNYAGQKSVVILDNIEDLDNLSPDMEHLLSNIPPSVETLIFDAYKAPQSKIAGMETRHIMMGDIIN